MKIIKPYRMDYYLSSGHSTKWKQSNILLRR